MALDLEGSFRRFFFDEFYIVKIALGNSPLAFTSWIITQPSAPLECCLEIFFGKASFGRFHIEKVSWAFLLWRVPYWDGLFGNFSFFRFYIEKESLGNSPLEGSILRRCPFRQFSFGRFIFLELLLLAILVWNCLEACYIQKLLWEILL